MAEGDPAFGQVIGAHSDGDFVAEDNPDAEPAQLSCEVGVHFRAGFCFYEKRASWVHLSNLALNLN